MVECHISLQSKLSVVDKTSSVRGGVCKIA